MRILMTTDTVGGVWTYSLALAGALQPYGAEVNLATMGRVSESQRRAAGSIANMRLFESDFQLEWMENAWDDVQRAGEWLVELERLLAPDVIHLGGYAYARQPFRAPVVVVAHSCCLSWWDAVKDEPPPKRWERYRREVTAGLQSADLIIAPSVAMRDKIARIYRPTTAMRVIYNGRDPVRAALGQRRELVLAAGRLWDEAKNIAALRDVAAELPWPIEIAGNPLHPDGREVHAGALHMLGVLDEHSLASHMANASIYALPARYEPFGLSILEAALAGCALVLGDIPSLREIWQDTALFVPPDQPDQLRTALNDLIDNSSRRAALASRSSARALRYSTTAMAQHYVHAYRDLLRTPHLREKVA